MIPDHSPGPGPVEYEMPFTFERVKEMAKNGWQLLHVGSDATYYLVRGTSGAEQAQALKALKEDNDALFQERNRLAARLTKIAELTSEPGRHLVAAAQFDGAGRPDPGRTSRLPDAVSTVDPRSDEGNEMDSTTDLTGLRVGEWTATGWGAQHRVRSVTDTHVTVVCHGTEPWHRAEIGRVDTTADESLRCSRCAALPGLGPLVYADVGSVRQAPDGTLAVCVGDRGGPVNRWHLVGEETEPGMHGWRDDWQVCAWRPAGNVRDIPCPSGPKLIRDRIPQIALANDGVPLPVRVAPPDEMRGLLRAKLIEEVAEYLDSDNPAELADILEVVRALALLAGIAPEVLELRRLVKEKERGGFADRLVWTPDVLS